MSALRFRQVHLDFHTSEQIPNVGSGFKAEQFQDALRKGHVDSITLFAKCHHGLSYHPTRVGQMHPTLTFDLLGAQMQASREIDVKTPIYISAGFDEHIAREHPDWRVVSKDGQMMYPKPLEAGWKLLCFNSPYLDYLCAQIEEVADEFGASDGIFLDITAPHRCYCPRCLDGMLAQGLNPQRDEDAQAFAFQTLQTYFRRSTEAARKGDDARRVFHNSGHVPKGAGDWMKWQSHLELESLPTGGWGYDHFPISARYAGTTGLDYLGMTGKFHTTWGEFGGFKREAALRFECAAMLAWGAKCSVGDQLHPSGAMNDDTYRLIGAAYEEVEAKEAWCRNATPVCDIAILSPEALHADTPLSHRHKGQAEEGASRMLLELGAQFEVVDFERDFSLYKLLILPDEVTLDSSLQAKIEAFLNNGGKLLLSGRSGMNEETSGFALDIGLRLEGRGESDPDYLLATERAPTAPVRSAFVVHGGAWNVSANGEWNMLATRLDSYFNRAYNHFCSHQHAPDAGASPFPGAVCNGQIAYFAHDIFTCYRGLGQPLYRDLVFDALQQLLPTPILTTSLPTAGRASLMRQAGENRFVLHLLFATPQKRGADVSSGWATGVQAVEIIEDLFPLFDVRCEVRASQPARSVRLVPSGEEVPFSVEGEVVRFSVPRLLCHQMIEIAS